MHFKSIIISVAALTALINAIPVPLVPVEGVSAPNILRKRDDNTLIADVDVLVTDVLNDANIDVLRKRDDGALVDVDALVGDVLDDANIDVLRKRVSGPRSALSI